MCCAHYSWTPVSYIQHCEWMFCILEYVVTTLMEVNTPWCTVRVKFLTHLQHTNLSRKYQVTLLLWHRIPDLAQLEQSFCIPSYINCLATILAVVRLLMCKVVKCIENKTAKIWRNIWSSAIARSVTVQLNVCSWHIEQF